MHKSKVEVAVQQFKALERGLFECCYVNSAHAEATYTLCWSGEVDFNDVIWFRTIDILTGEVKREGSIMNDFGKYHALTDAIGAHYSPEYIKQDATLLACEFAANAVEYVRDGKNNMHYHIVFGQSLFYADVDQLRGKTSCGEDFQI